MRAHTGDSGCSDGFELETRQLGMSPSAAALWIEFYDAIELEQATGSELQGARAFASKAAEHAARIAGIIQMVNDPDAIEVRDGAGELAACPGHRHRPEPAQHN